MVRLQVLAAIDHAQGHTIRDRIKAVSQHRFVDPETGHTHQFTWRTISTWFYRYKKGGVTTLDKKTRSDKNKPRKVQVAELAEAINEVLPSLTLNKVGKIPKSTLYRCLLERNYFTRQQIAPNTFSRFVREHDLLNTETTEKLRTAFAMQYANELWQGDTMYGPSILQHDKRWEKTFLIAFIDDASRLITHAEFFYRDNTQNMVDAFRTALYKRGKPERLYFDNGANYTSKEILQACVRLDIRLSHAPVRDGAAKGKIERFFRGFRDRFLVMHSTFNSLDQLNQMAQDWIENHYNNQHHSGIHMNATNCHYYHNKKISLTLLKFMRNKADSLLLLANLVWVKRYYENILSSLIMNANQPSYHALERYTLIAKLFGSWPNPFG